ncbi:hypothetical protein HK405_006097, partial [Cladochytrium tenue]
MSSFGPNDTIVLITGANSGIGLDTAARLANDAAHKYHVILAVRSLDKGRAAVADIQARATAAGLAAPSLTLLQLDVADPSSVAAAAASLAAEQLPRIDVLINNAGIIKFPSGSLSADLNDTLATNAVGPAIVTATLLPLLKASSNPRLIYVSSGLGSIARLTDPTLPFSIPFGLEYRMSKAALNMLAVYHHREFATWGCKVWAFCPGYVVTNLSGAEDRENRVLRGAVSAEVPAQALADVLEGHRDADAGKFIHKDGTYD